MRDYTSGSEQFDAASRYQDAMNAHNDWVVATRKHTLAAFLDDVEAKRETNSHTPLELAVAVFAVEYLTGTRPYDVELLETLKGPL